MSRNASGVYSLPSSVNPVVTNTQITTNWANTTLNDLASEMTNSLDRNGRGRMNVPFLMLDGSVSNPAYGFTNAPNSGIYNYGSGKLGFTVGGVLQMILGPTGVEGTLNVPTQAASDNSTKVASTAFVQAVAFNSVNLPAQGGNANKYIKTDGTNASWQFVNLQTGTESVLNSQKITWADTDGANQAAAFRNLIVNGNMNVNQRVIPANIGSVGVSSGRPIDRWYVNLSATTGNVVPTRAFDSPTPALYGDKGQYSLRLTVSVADAAVAAGDLAYVLQAVHGWDARRLFGKTFTFSFWVRSSKTGDHVGFLQNLVDRYYLFTYTVNVANTWEQKTVTVSGGIPTVGGTWNFENGFGLYVGWTLMAGTTWYGAGLNTWTSGAGGFYGWGGTVNVLDTIGNIFAVTNVQLEVGNTATPFEYKPYSIELNECQRYYQQVPSNAMGFAFSTTVAYFGTTLRVPMRTTPSVVSLNASPGTTVAGAGPTIVAGTWAIKQVTEKSVLMQFTRSAGTWTAGQVVVLENASEVVALDADF